MNNQENFKVTFDEAKKKLMAMTLINNFLWNSANENEEDAKTIASIILSNVLDSKVEVLDVTIQKEFAGADTIYHGIRMDAHINRSKVNNKVTATVYDIEMEDREADRRGLPRRLRFYSALPDSKELPSSEDYQNMPDFISVVILSYDPFLIGDMYYEAKMHLSTHPDYDYDDGRTFILLYADGKPNFEDMVYGKKVQELLKYIVSGELSTHNDDIKVLDEIVTKVKSKTEVTRSLMKQWDREMSIRREIKEEVKAEVTAEVTAEVSREYAIKQIKSSRKYNASDADIRQDLKDSYSYDDDMIDELFEEVDKNKQ